MPLEAVIYLGLNGFEKKNVKQVPVLRTSMTLLVTLYCLTIGLTYDRACFTYKSVRNHVQKYHVFSSHPIRICMSRSHSNGAKTASEIIEFASALRPSNRRSSLGDRAFLVAAARSWNSLPSTVTAQTAASTLRSFPSSPENSSIHQIFPTISVTLSAF